MSQSRPDLVAINATLSGDINKLKTLIESPDASINYHDIFTAAVKNNKNEIIYWMMRNVMTTQLYPMGRLDAAVVAGVIANYGTQMHIDWLSALYSGHISGLMRPEVINIAKKRNLVI
ncbi:hypothetical protein D5b_00041 [Faustovirus]|nr:hypothetical protein D5b_00041 [Faustovirus]AMN84868.1 hypothetical protein D6_00469 [Faustovirus]AMP44000.1 hypothetical protein PRJ_Dakar_00040 [Faustovirus]